MNKESLLSFKINVYAFYKKKSNKINAAHDKCEKNIRNFFEVCLRKRLEGYIYTVPWLLKVELKLYQFIPVKNDCHYK